MINSERLMQHARRVLRSTEAYQYNQDLIPDEENYKIEYLLLKKEKSVLKDVLACASFEDQILMFHPLRENEQPIAQYDVLFTCGYNLFAYLEKGYSLINATADFHCCAWNEITDMQGHVEYPNGMQMYLKYCMQHSITKKYLAKATGYNGMDVMTLYDRQAAKGNLKKASQEPER